MKKNLVSISAVVAMMALTATFSACSSDDDGQKSSTRGTLILDADKSSYIDIDGEENGTRAISVTGDVLKTFWTETDLVTVYKNNWQNKIGELKPTSNTSSTATPTRTKLEGENFVTEGLKEGDALNLIYPRATWDYTGQDGTWDAISTKYDYATANVSVVYIDASANNKVYGTTALFGTAQQAIARFTLLDSNNTAFETTELTITTAGNQLVKKCSLNGTATDKGGALTIKTSTATNVFYVAIRNDNEGADQYTLTAKDDDGNVYSYTRSNVTLNKGTFKKYKVTMRLQDNTYTERDAYIDGGEEVWD